MLPYSNQHCHLLAVNKLLHKTCQKYDLKYDQMKILVCKSTISPKNTNDYMYCGGGFTFEIEHCQQKY